MSALRGDDLAGIIVRGIERATASLRAENATLKAALLAVEARVAVMEQRSPTPGRDGRDGPQGPSGADGQKGLDGQPGPMGPPGVPGGIGPVGPPGPAGEVGPPGPTGLDGREGQDGAPGERGEKGLDGANGKDGAPGVNGKDGADGLGITDALIDGDGLLVLTLTDGRVLKAGHVRGQDGAPGRDGVPGRDGLPGERGEKGLDGKDGADGLHGKDGAPGRDGVDGKNAVLDDLVLKQIGDREIALVHKANGAVWGALRLAGMTLYRGVWETTQDYEHGDQVTHKGSQWVAREDIAAGIEPGDGATAWQLSAKRGVDGKPGPRGPVGPEGKAGPSGRDLTQLDPDTGRKW